MGESMLFSYRAITTSRCRVDEILGCDFGLREVDLVVHSSFLRPPSSTTSPINCRLRKHLKPACKVYLNSLYKSSLVAFTLRYARFPRYRCAVCLSAQRPPFSYTRLKFRQLFVHEQHQPYAHECN